MNAASTTVVAVAWALFLAALLARPSARRPPLGASPADRRAGRETTEHSPEPRHRWRRRAARAAIDETVPDVIDLFAVAVAAGLNTRLALRAVAGRAPPGELADALRRVEHVVATTGARLADTIERLPEELATESVRPLVAAITDAERYGAALGPTLDRMAEDARRARQRRAEEAARRLPVKLLFPLVTCILPAFGLLTVAPLIAGGLRALRL